MPSYYIWTEGCQMNVSDSERLSVALERLGYQPSQDMEAADVVVFNSCVVRQSAEDRVTGKLGQVRPLKCQSPGKTVVLMGCMVGPSATDLKRRFPHVDLFLRPQQFDPLLEMLAEKDGTCLDAVLDDPLIPLKPQVAAYVPIIHGCDKFCTFCIIPYRRGRERSRPVPELAQEVQALVRRGVKEVTLLGQNVDSYGNDLPDKPDLADLLDAINSIPGLLRIRFLTSHPNDMSQKLIDAVARLERVCEWINLPCQAGDDEVLARMHRGYTRADYLRLVRRIRKTVPNVSLSTDVIVGFCGETAGQFQHTLDLLAEVRFDKVHVAAYSTRPGTIASRKLVDDVPLEEKRHRLRAVEDLQEQIATETNAGLLGRMEEVLVEGREKGQWYGRTRSNKLVHIFVAEEEADLTGTLVQVRIEQTSPWYLVGSTAEEPVQAAYSR